MRPVCGAASSRHPAQHFILPSLDSLKTFGVPHFTDVAAAFSRVNLQGLSGQLRLSPSGCFLVLGRLHLPQRVSPPGSVSGLLSSPRGERASRKRIPHSFPGTWRGQQRPSSAGPRRLGIDLELSHVESGCQVFETATSLNQGLTNPFYS